MYIVVGGDGYKKCDVTHCYMSYWKQNTCFTDEMALHIFMNFYVKWACNVEVIFISFHPKLNVSFYEIWSWGSAMHVVR
jgi:hypothetical protein